MATTQTLHFRNLTAGKGTFHMITPKRFSEGKMIKTPHGSKKHPARVYRYDAHGSIRRVGSIEMVRT